MANRRIRSLRISLFFCCFASVSFRLAALLFFDEDAAEEERFAPVLFFPAVFLFAVFVFAPDATKFDLHHK